MPLNTIILQNAVIELYKMALKCLTSLQFLSSTVNVLYSEIYWRVQNLTQMLNFYVWIAMVGHHTVYNRVLHMPPPHVHTYVLARAHGCGWSL